jgi:hypothetical protein
MSKLNMVWTKHLQGEAKTNFESLLRNSTTVLSRLRDILKEKEEDLTSQECSNDDFLQPGWEYRQAFRLGQKAQLREIQSLLKFIENR